MVDFKKLWDEDQSDRRNWESIGGKEVYRRDLERQRAVEEAYKKGLIKTPADKVWASMIFHHGNYPEQYQTALELAQQAALEIPENDDDELSRRAREMSRLAEDRYLLSIGKSQKYGTQYYDDDQLRSPEEDKKRVVMLEKEAEPQKIPDSYYQWKNDPSKENLSAVLNNYDRLIKSEANKYSGVLAKPTLYAKAKSITIDAVKTFEPNRGTALSTHIVSNLRRLNRANYEASRSVRLPEDLQRGVGSFLTSRNELFSKLGREPSAAELADDLNWPISKVQRMERSLRGEATSAEVTFEPGIITPEYEDTRIDFVYHDLPNRDKLIFEHTTGYGGKPILKKKEIASKLGVSPAVVSQRSIQIAKQLREAMNP